MLTSSVLRSPHIVALAIALLPGVAFAAWPNSPYVNLPLCTAANSQETPAIVSDGAGGAIVTWHDGRSGTSYDIYAGHVLASGAPDPAWPANGRALCIAPYGQYNPMVVSDGSGGAIVTWRDARNGDSDIYAQRVLANGTVDPAWPTSGRALCTAADEQWSPAIVSDGTGGAIVTWHDYRDGDPHIYAQRVLASGTVDPAWPADGRALCTAFAGQQNPALVPDGAGGAIATWQDDRGIAWDIYAQHVLASGAVDPAWPADGRALCTAVDGQEAPAIVSDGAGGAIVTWQDFRSGTAWDIYAQHVLASGAADAAWPADGRALCTAIDEQGRPTLAADGAGGAIVSWHDRRSGTSYDIYAQHVLASGAVDAAWPSEGRALSTAANNQWYPSVVSDGGAPTGGGSGAIVTWGDNRNGNYDIYAQHVLASGAVDPSWPADGRALSTASATQGYFTVVVDGSGGALVTWADFRGGSSDIYAQRVARYGYLGTPEAELAGVRDVPGDNGGKVKVSWSASYLDVGQDANLAAYDLLRSVPPNVAAMRLARGERPAASLAELAGTAGMIALPGAAQGYYWELLSTVSALHYVSGYSYIAPTLNDSIGAGNPRTAFMVVARNAANTMYWPSRPDSGYSVDNIPPLTPAPFTANYATGTTHLHWSPSPEADLAGYRLYRDAAPSFTPSPASLIAALPDTGYADPASATYTYKLTAVDVHGNESPVATISPAAITGVEGGAPPRELALAPASPNPASHGTTLRFALPAGATVSLGVFDAAGRLVRSLASGAMPAGEHASVWNLRDERGRIVGAGLYFVRLDVAGATLTRRIAVTP